MLWDYFFQVRHLLFSPVFPFQDPLSELLPPTRCHDCHRNYPPGLPLPDLIKRRRARDAILEAFGNIIRKRKSTCVEV